FTRRGSYLRMAMPSTLASTPDSVRVLAARLGDQREQRDGEHEPRLEARRLERDRELLGEEPEDLPNERGLLALAEERVLRGQDRKEPAQQRCALLFRVSDLRAGRVEDVELVTDERAQALLLDRSEQLTVRRVDDVVVEVDRDYLSRLHEQQRPGLRL